MQGDLTDDVNRKIHPPINLEAAPCLKSWTVLDHPNYSGIGSFLEVKGAALPLDQADWFFIRPHCY